MKYPVLQQFSMACTAGLFSFSLMAASNPVTPAITAYYANYDVYFNNACNPSVNPDTQVSSAGHAVAQPGYPVSGATANPLPMSANCILQSANPNSKENADLLDKVRSIDGLAYSFLGVNDSGVLYFNDTWADLSQDDAAFCGSNTAICGNLQQPPTNWNDYLYYGNFDAAAKLADSKSKSLSIAVGGWITQVNYYHVFSDNTHINSFVDSLASIKTHFPQMGTVDFDIENNFPGDSDGKDFQAFFSNGTFAQLVSAIRTDPRTSALNINLTIQANPAYITGFIGPALNKNNLVANIQYVHLMSYDFFVNSDTKTGFNSNLYPSADSEFSVDAAVAALMSYTPSTKIKIGVPAYERSALTGISPKNYGLGQVIPQGTSILPGDMDRIGVTTSQGANNPYYCYNKTGSAPSGLEPCSGIFTYRYIMNTMLKNGFVATNHPDAVATTAFANQFSVQAASSFNGATVQGVQKSYPSLSSNNVYISYISAMNACQYGKYAQQKKLAGGILWEVLGDLPPSDDDSLMNAFNWGFADNDCNAIVPLAPMPQPITLSINYGISTWIAGYRVEYQNGHSTYVSVQGSTEPPATLSSNTDNTLTTSSIKDIVIDYGSGTTALCNSTHSLAPLSENATAQLNVPYWGQCDGFDLIY